MRLLCIKGHDVINLQIKSIKSFISENCSCQKKSMPEKREDSYQTTSIAWKKMAAKIINVEEYISMSMCKKKKKLIANNFKRIVMIPLNVNSIFKTNISNNYHVQ